MTTGHHNLGILLSDVDIFSRITTIPSPMLKPVQQ